MKITTSYISAMIVCVLFARGPASADDSCDGHWVGRYSDAARGWETTAEIDISGDTGYWMSRLGLHKKKNSPCRDVVFPMKVLKCTNTEIELIVDGSSVMSPRGDTCPNHHSRLVRKDSDTAEGTMGGRETTLIITRRKAD